MVIWSIHIPSVETACSTTAVSLVCDWKSNSDTHVVPCPVKFWMLEHKVWRQMMPCLYVNSIVAALDSCWSQAPKYATIVPQHGLWVLASNNQMLQCKLAMACTAARSQLCFDIILHIYRHWECDACQLSLKPGPSLRRSCACWISLMWMSEYIIWRRVWGNCLSKLWSHHNYGFFYSDYWILIMSNLVQMCSLEQLATYVKSYADPLLVKVIVQYVWLWLHQVSGMGCGSLS